MNSSILTKSIGYILLFILLSVPFSATAQALSAGDIAFVGFNSDGDDHFAIILLRDITNETIYFTDREVNSTSGLEASNAEGTLEWNTGATTIPVGTVVVFTDIDSPSNTNYGVSHGTLSTPDLGFNFAQTGDGILAFVGTNETTPTNFLAGIQNIQNPTSDPTIGFGDTTGLNLTCAAYTITRNNHDDGGAYISGFGTRNAYKDYLLDLKDIDNWNTETSNGSDILPFPMTPITLACTTPKITGMDQTICNKDSVLLSDLITGRFEGGIKYGSTFGGFGDTITMKVAPSIQTTYFVLDSLADSDCKDTAKIVISVNPAPVLTAKDTAICAGESIDLSKLISGTLIENLSYGSTFGTYGATSTFSPTATTTYFVNNEESTNNCSDTTQVVIDVNPQPSITTRDTTIDIGTAIDLSLLVNETATGTLEYGISVNDLNSANNTVSPIINTTYIVRDSVAATKCAVTTDLLVTINNTPINTEIIPTLSEWGLLILALLILNLSVFFIQKKEFLV